MKMPAKHKIAYLFFLLVLSLSVLGIEDYRAFSTNAQVEICPLSNVVDPVTIINTGNSYSEYTIRLFGDAAPYVTAVPYRVGLMPGESAVINNYFHFPSGAIGEYELTVNIVTDLGLEKEFMQDINAKICNNNQLLAYTFNATACPCTRIRYDFFVRNTGSYTETYRFGLDEFSSYANVSVNPLVLGPGEYANVSLYIQPDCEIYGDNIINFYSIAAGSGIRTRVPILMNIERCYDFDVQTGLALPDNDDKFNISFSARDGEYSVCAQDNTSIQVMIDNSNYIGNNFFYNVEGPKFGGMYGEVVRLFGYEQGFTFLDLSPDEDDIGQHHFVINVESQLGDEIRQEAVSVNVEGCYGLLVEAEDEEIICDCSSNKIGFNVFNSGRFRERVNLEIEGPEFFRVINSTVLDADEGKDITINADLSCGKRFEGKIKLKAYSEKAYSEAVIDVDTKEIGECYDVRVDAASTDISFERSMVPIMIEHQGFKGGNYTIDVSGPEWISFDTDHVMLNPGDTYSFDILALPDNVSSGRYLIEINISTENVVYRKEAVLNLEEDTFGLGDLLWHYRYYLIFGSIFVVLLIVLALFLREKARVWKIRRLIRKANNGKSNHKAKRSNWRIIVIIISVLILGLVAYLFFSEIVMILQYLLVFVLDYIWYIIIGFVLLLAAILILGKLEK